MRAWQTKTDMCSICMPMSDGINRAEITENRDSIWITNGRRLGEKTGEDASFFRLTTQKDILKRRKEIGPMAEEECPSSSDE